MSAADWSQTLSTAEGLPPSRSELTNDHCGRIATEDTEPGREDTESRPLSHEEAQNCTKTSL
jgi:hypothetical protein